MRRELERPGADGWRRSASSMRQNGRAGACEMTQPIQPKIPPQATTEADRQKQRRLMTSPVRSCTVVVEYVDSNLCIAEAHDKGGQRVSLTGNTAGVDFKTLQVGSRLQVDVTALSHAVRARTADSVADGNG